MPTKRVKKPRLAADGKPSEMFKDVLRACHNRLMATDHEYVMQQERKAIWMSKRSLQQHRPNAKQQQAHQGQP